jgi:CDP-diacylglycerol--serine O-phosphatidyltransferase
MRTDKRHALRRRGIFLLPNLLTTLALFFGFYAIVSALKSHFGTACLTVFIAMIFDSLDGRIARMTNTSSAFGAEYDSLSDMVAFGIAPALIAYSWGLTSLGKLGWLAAFIYVAATALRLARFNTQIGRVSKRYFQGVPCPVAAAVMISMIWTETHYLIIPGLYMNIFTTIITILMAVLMVSTIPYYSFKEIDLKGRVPFVMILLFIVLCVLIAIDPPIVIFLGSFAFVLSGPIMFLFNWNKKRRIAGKQLFTRKHRSHL